MKPRLIANRLTKNCRLEQGRKYKRPGSQLCQREPQLPKEQSRRCFLKPWEQSPAHFNQPSVRVARFMILSPLPWQRAQCARPVARSDDKSFAEFLEEFSAARAGEDSCSHGPPGRFRTSHSDVATTKSPDTLRVIRRFESFFVYCFGEAAGLEASFFLSFSALAGFTSMLVAVIV
jgi:hypothetical protein